jgi:small nuclear ribonucleoprotein (snRNP)-like protein
LIDRICDICKEFNNNDNWVIKLSDDKEFIEFNGHSKCIDEYYNTIKNIKDLHKKSVKQILKELNLRR